MKKVAVFPSIMCCKPWDWKNYLRSFEKVGVEAIHFDVMDGHYVPNVSLGSPDFSAIHAETALPVDVHMMCTNPAEMFSYFKAQPGDWFSFHPEVCLQPYRLLEQIRTTGAKAGLAISPGVPLGYIEECLSVLDFILVMAVSPGFASQKMVPDHLSKLRRICEMTQKADHPIDVVVDGNTTVANARKMMAAGATGFVTGTSSMLNGNVDDFEKLYHEYVTAVSEQTAQEG